jgi:hypothetical protein
MRDLKIGKIDEALLCLLGSILICLQSTVLIYGLKNSVPPIEHGGVGVIEHRSIEPNKHLLYFKEDFELGAKNKLRGDSLD